MAKDKKISLTRFGTGPTNFRHFLIDPIFDALHTPKQKVKINVEEEVAKFCKEIGFPLHIPANKNFVSTLEKMYWEVGMDTFDMPKSVYERLPKETVTLGVVIGDRLFPEKVTARVYAEDPVYGKVLVLTAKEYEKYCC